MQIDHKNINMQMLSWEKSPNLELWEHRGDPNLPMGVRESFLEEGTLELTLKNKKALARQKKWKSHVEGIVCAKA